MSGVTKSNEPISVELKELVIARLLSIPNNVTISVGDEGDFTRAEIIERVKREDTVGREVVRSQLEFLRALSTGRLLDELTSGITN